MEKKEIYRTLKVVWIILLIVAFLLMAFSQGKDMFNEKYANKYFNNGYQVCINDNLVKITESLNTQQRD